MLQPHTGFADHNVSVVSTTRCPHLFNSKLFLVAGNLETLKLNL